MPKLRDSVTTWMSSGIGRQRLGDAVGVVPAAVVDIDDFDAEAALDLEIARDLGNALVQGGKTLGLVEQRNDDRQIRAWTALVARGRLIWSVSPPFLCNLSLSVSCAIYTAPDAALSRPRVKML